MHLIIGGDGGLGKVLRTRIARDQWIATTRRDAQDWTGSIYLDLAKPIGELPTVIKFVYLVAAVTKIVECERDQARIWVVNADAPVEIGRRYVAKGAFVVFVSSDAVEFMGHSAYGRQKAYVESFMLTIGAAVVRPSRIEPDSRVALADFMIDVAMNRRSGLHRWR